MNPSLLVKLATSLPFSGMLNTVRKCLPISLLSMYASSQVKYSSRNNNWSYSMQAIHFVILFISLV